MEHLILYAQNIKFRAKRDRLLFFCICFWEQRWQYVVATGEGRCDLLMRSRVCAWERRYKVQKSALPDKPFKASEFLGSIFKFNLRRTARCFCNDVNICCEGWCALHVYVKRGRWHYYGACYYAKTFFLSCGKFCQSQRLFDQKCTFLAF